MISILIAVILTQGVNVQNEGTNLGKYEYVNCVGPDVHCSGSGRIVTISIDAGVAAAISTAIPRIDGGQIAYGGADGGITSEYRFRVSADGGMCIGCTPASDFQATLQVETTPALSSSGPRVLIMNGIGGTGATATLDVTTYGITRAQSPGFRLLATDNGSFGTGITLQTKLAGAIANGLVDRLTIAVDGKIGINDSTPSFMLDVAGTAVGGILGRFVGGAVGADVTNGNFSLFASNGTDASVLLGPVSTGWSRIYTDVAGRYLTIAAGNKVDTLWIREGKVGVNMDSNSRSETLQLNGSFFSTGTRPRWAIKDALLTRFFHVGTNGDGVMWWANNLDYDGTNWNRDDTGQSGWLEFFRNDAYSNRVEWIYTPSGATPATLTSKMSLNPTGLIIGDNGATGATEELDVRGDVIVTGYVRGRGGELRAHAYVDASCTASPCTIAIGAKNINSITRSAAGSYRINFTSSLTDEFYTPSVTPVWGAADADTACGIYGSRTNTYFDIRCNAAGALTDSGFSVSVSDDN